MTGPAHWRILPSDWRDLPADVVDKAVELCVAAGNDRPHWVNGGDGGDADAPPHWALYVSDAYEALGLPVPDEETLRQWGCM